MNSEDDDGTEEVPEDEGDRVVDEEAMGIRGRDMVGTGNFSDFSDEVLAIAGVEPLLIECTGVKCVVSRDLSVLFNLATA